MNISPGVMNTGIKYTVLVALPLGVGKGSARSNCKYISLESTLATLISYETKELGNNKH